MHGRDDRIIQKARQVCRAACGLVTRHAVLPFDAKQLPQLSSAYMLHPMFPLHRFFDAYCIHTILALFMMIPSTYIFLGGNCHWMMKIQGLMRRKFAPNSRFSGNSLAGEGGAMIMKTFNFETPVFQSGFCSCLAIGNSHLKSSCSMDVLSFDPDSIEFIVLCTLHGLQPHEKQSCGGESATTPSQNTIHKLKAKRLEVRIAIISVRVTKKGK